jgi:hypothetical protein
MSQETTGKAFGWVVEVKQAPPTEPLLYNVAEPNKEQAVEAVRRRIPGAAGASVEATTALSSNVLYGQLRMRRGDVAKVT